MIDVRIPRIKDFYNPVLQALHNLGGSGTRKEILDEVITNSGLTVEQLESMRYAEEDRQSTIQYRIGHAQTHLKRFGLLENPSRGVWALTDEGGRTTEIDPDQVERVPERALEEEDAGGHGDSISMFEQTSTRQVSIPTLDKLMNPMLLVLHRLGGSGTNDEINDGVAELIRLTDEQIQVPHAPGKGTQTEYAYRLSMVRRYLKGYGLLENPKPKNWVLTEKCSTVSRVNPFAVILHAQHIMWEERLKRQRSLLTDLTDIDQTLSW